jgi:hypothetical protein
MTPDRRDRQFPLLSWRQRVWTRCKLLTWRQFYTFLLEAIVVGGGMAAWVMWVGYDRQMSIVVGMVAGVGTLLMLLVI